MIRDVELLNNIYEGAEMGTESIQHIISLSDNAEFIKMLSEQQQEYKKIQENAEKMIREKNMEVKGIGTFAKMMANISSDLKTITNHSPEKLSEIMIQGSTMGITNIVKQMNDYSGDNKEVLSLAKQQLKTEQNNIEQLKKFL